MAQATFGDDDLFDEATDEVRSDVEEHLDAARAALPDADAVWTVEADNALGVLNGLRSALDPGDAVDHLRSAKKWYTMGERAGAFDEDDALADEIEALDDLVTDVDEANSAVGDLAATIPEIRSGLQDAAEDDGAGDDAEATAASAGAADD